jgi:hypothetical protein
VTVTGADTTGAAETTGAADALAASVLGTAGRSETEAAAAGAVAAGDVAAGDVAAGDVAAVACAWPWLEQPTTHAEPAIAATAANTTRSNTGMHLLASCHTWMRCAARRLSQTAS